MRSLLPVFLEILLLTSPLALVGQSAAEPFTLELIAPISTPGGDREISLDRYHRFHAMLTNVSNQDQRIWKDWNTWGYFNLRLEWTTSQQRKTVTRVAPASWDGDYPDFWVIRPGEHLILEIDMSSGKWAGIPDLYGEQIEASLRAIYENKADALSREFEIWSGRLESKALKVLFK